MSEQAIKSSDTSKKLDSKEKFAVFFAWLQIYDERIGRLFILTLGVFAFYLYFGLIAPNTSKSRVDKLEVARNDLEKISDQYTLLKKRYIAFLSQPNAAVPISIFSDTIIPSIKTYKNNEQGTLSEQEEEYLTKLSEDLETLSELYKKKNRNRIIVNEPNLANNEQFREQVIIFRETLGSLLTGKYDPSQSESSKQKTYDISEEDKKVRDKLAINKLSDFLVDGRITDEILPDDPVNNLENLDKLEQVIQNMIELSGSSVNRSLMDKARQSLDSRLRASFSSTNSGVYFGDTITQSFATYENVMQNYSSAPETFKFTSEKYLSSYKAIKEYLDTPFDVKTIGDLNRLKEYADGLINKNISETQSPILNVPIINADIDRIVILVFLPILLLVLLHATNRYVYRYYSLSLEISNEDGLLKPNDIVKFAPVQFFYHFNQLDVIKLKPSRIFKLSEFTNKYFSLFLVTIFILMPIFTAVIFYYALYNQRYGITRSWIIGLIFLGIFILVLMSVEMYLIYSCLKRIISNSEIRSVSLSESITNLPQVETHSLTKQVLEEGKNRLKKPLKGDKDENNK